MIRILCEYLIEHILVAPGAQQTLDPMVHLQRLRADDHLRAQRDPHARGLSDQAERRPLGPALERVQHPAHTGQRLHPVTCALAHLRRQRLPLREPRVALSISSGSRTKSSLN